MNVQSNLELKIKIGPKGYRDWWIMKMEVDSGLEASIKLKILKRWNWAMDTKWCFSS